jgi:hypothetical protein
VPYTMEDFRRDYAKEHFKDLTPAERRELIRGLSPEERDEIEKDLKRCKEKTAPAKRRKRS